MSGGIAQLVAIGAQDAHLVGQPEVSFFRSNYKRHTNFAQTVERQTIQGNPTANGMSSIRFERKGDMIGYTYIAPNDGTKAVKFSPADWTGAISQVELLIGGQVIDTQTSNFSTYIAPSVLSQNLSKSTSGFAEAAESKFYPLRFSFCENAQSALPLIALQYHDVELRITWGSNIQSAKFEVYTQFIHLDTDERTTLSSTPQNMVITQTQRAIASGSKVQELNFNHPIKCLAAGDGSALSIAADANKMKLQINGTDVADYKYVDPHYTAISSFYHTPSSKPITSITTTSSTLASNVLTVLNAQTYTSTDAASGENDTFFLYPFCIDTSKIQPTGSLNFSRLDSARLVSDTANSDDDIYAINYNILRIENGMGGLMYSN
tara:strand:- start:1211 stop:2344 length:1134 start_codon:yes stop_codon:yes gene_type:complete